jgi:hypothetical protein
MGQYLRYIAAGQIQLAVFVDLDRWSRQRLTPLWLEVAVDPGETLRALEAEQPRRVYYDGVRGRPVIPLTLPLHVEHDVVVGHLVDEISQIVALVKDCPPTAQVRASAPDQDEATAQIA